MRAGKYGFSGNDRYGLLAPDSRQWLSRMRVWRCSQIRGLRTALCRSHARLVPCNLASARARAAARDSMEPIGKWPGRLVWAVAIECPASASVFIDFAASGFVPTVAACCDVGRAGEPIRRRAVTRIFLELGGAHFVEKLVQVDAF